MRIGLVATAAAQVARRPGAAGSVERVVWLLARELSSAGHQVTVFAVAGSAVPGARVVETLPGPYGTNGAPDDWRLCDWISVARAVELSGEFDVLHSHCYLDGVPLEGLSRAPLFHTLHVWPFDGHAWLSRTHPSLRILGLTHRQWAHTAVRPLAVVGNPVDAADFPLGETAGDYVCWLGRFTPGKGPLAAVRAAREAGTPVVLAGPANDYFHEVIEPLVDDHAVRYVGPLEGTARGALLRGARALLWPLSEPEPFGLVAVEAMCCGTPVVTRAIGAAQEIVEDGLSGVVVREGRAWGPAIAAAAELPRRRVRERALARYSPQSVAGAHIAAYSRVVGRRTAAPRGPAS